MRNIKRNKWLLLIVTVLIVMGIGTPVYIYYYPHIIYTTWENTIVDNGFGATPNATGIPVNTLYTMTTIASPIYAQQCGRRKPRHALHGRRA